MGADAIGWRKGANLILLPLVKVGRGGSLVGAGDGALDLGNEIRYASRLTSHFHRRHLKSWPL